jgi:hypothetical protein
MYVSKDGRIRGYFTKPRGVREQQQDWETTLYRKCGQTRASTDIVENLRRIQLSKYTRPVFEVLGVFRIK